MRAMVLERVKTPLVFRELADPEPAAGQIRLRISACGVCRTDLHLIDGELPQARLPIVPGHEIVGYIDKIGAGVTEFSLGQRSGIPWLGAVCGTCFYCRTGQENLCDRAQFTGCMINGGYASHAIADARFVFSLGGAMDDVSTAPLLCAGLIGWRSLVKAGSGDVLGLYGFGAAGHIVLQVAKFQGRRVFAFTRPGDTAAQNLARKLGADWAGGADEHAPLPLDAAIIYAPEGALVPAALRAVRKGGRVVCAGIHMSDIPRFAYADLWGEREIVSVANLTRQDGIDFLRIAAQAAIRTETVLYPLERANQALEDLRNGRFQGVAVLAM